MTEGIFGVIDFEKPIENPDELCQRMQRFLAIDQSGPSSVSVRVSKNHVLGMKRAARFDYQQGEISENSETQRLCLIHGEYHNYRDIVRAKGVAPQGDLDLALTLYNEQGPAFGKNLNGLFSIAILDSRERTFILLNDRFGLAHQVYWTIVNRRFYFATHLKTLMTCSGIPREMDTEGLNLFLKYSYVPSPWTNYKGIKKLQPGHLLIFKDGDATHNRYWEFSRDGNRVSDVTEASAEYKRLLKASISRRFESQKDVGILLSGGLDSSANVALAAQCTERKLKTFAIGFEDPTFDERPFARIVAQHFDTEHHEYTITGDEIEHLPKLVWHMEEPYFEFGLFLTYLGMASAKKEVDVVLGGEGADQLFGTGGFVKGLPVALRYLLTKYHLLRSVGFVTRALKGKIFYEHDNPAFKTRLLLDRVVDLNNWYFYGYDAHELKLLYKNSALARIPKIFENPAGGSEASFEALYTETQINQDVTHYVNENVMVKSGRMADMLGLTLRESFLDKEVADFLVSMDYRFKRSGDLFDHLKGKVKTKFLHRKAMEGLLPEEIMTKPKQGGFVPVMIFLNDPKLRKRIYNHLINSEPIRQYFNLDYVKSIFSLYESVQGRKVYWHNFYNSKANRILFLLTFDIWYHFYMKSDPLDTSPLSLTDYLT